MSIKWFSKWLHSRHLQNLYDNLYFKALRHFEQEKDAGSWCLFLYYFVDKIRVSMTQILFLPTMLVKWLADCHQEKAAAYIDKILMPFTGWIKMRMLWFVRHYTWNVKKILSDNVSKMHILNVILYFSIEFNRIFYKIKIQCEWFNPYFDLKRSVFAFTRTQ